MRHQPFVFADCEAEVAEIVGVRMIAEEAELEDRQADVARIPSAMDEARARQQHSEEAEMARVTRHLGMPRSGTTLTEHILAAHPQVFGAGERSAVHGLIRNLAGRVDTVASVSRLASLAPEVLTDAAAEFLSELHLAARAPAIRLESNAAIEASMNSLTAARENG